MDSLSLFNHLLKAETEEAVTAILSNAGYLVDDETVWHPLGFENNFSAIGNQQSDPSAALVEKVINSIDAMLMAKCFEHGIDPEGPDAPQTMAEAVERFFGVREGRISNLSDKEQGELAENINLVAVGSRQNPNYLIIDRGEGQTPARFPDTLVSLQRSNKMRIPFVQGKFNSGGTGILQFCGRQNYELIVSRRKPGCPVAADDNTASDWGFTLVRRMLPSGGRRSSVYVYLAPNGKVPFFAAEAIKVLPGKSRKNYPAPAYATDLAFGTCIKLYDYRWKAKSTITTDGRFELERLLYLPCLPFRVVETRDYTANLYSASIVGGWVSAVAENDEGESAKLEAGFPASAELTLNDIGTLPYQIAVYKEGSVDRKVPHGVSFVVNGHVHGSLAADFVKRRLKYDYLDNSRSPLLVTVDCTAMDARVREDFFMASRDRVRRNEAYFRIEDALATALREHPGLQRVNQLRRKKEMEKHLDADAPLSAFQSLLDADPTLSSLFAAGERLVTSTGPGDTLPFVGRRFPTYFRLAHEPKGGLTKPCPINRTCRVEFETDAVNDYFSRPNQPGCITVDPPNLCEHSRLWNGKFDTRFRVPWNAIPGDLVQISVTVTDPDRETHGMPFTSSFTIKAEPEVPDEPHPSGQPAEPHGSSGKPVSKGWQVKSPALALPKIREIRKEEWESESPAFDQYDAVHVRHDGEGGYDYLINVDNTFLLTELAKAKPEDRPIVKQWFEYGLVLAAVGMIKHNLRRAATATPATGPTQGHQQDDDSEDLDAIGLHCSGLAQVIVPIIRTLSRTMVPA
jgi:hypothetical protein